MIGFKKSFAIFFLSQIFQIFFLLVKDPLFQNLFLYSSFFTLLVFQFFYKLEYKFYLYLSFFYFLISILSVIMVKFSNEGFLNLFLVNFFIAAISIFSKQLNKKTSSMYVFLSKILNLLVEVTPYRFFIKNKFTIEVIKKNLIILSAFSLISIIFIIIFLYKVKFIWWVYGSQIVLNFFQIKFLLVDLLCFSFIVISPILLQKSKYINRFYMIYILILLVVIYYLFLSEFIKIETSRPIFLGVKKDTNTLTFNGKFFNIDWEKNTILLNGKEVADLVDISESSIEVTIDTNSLICGKNNFQLISNSANYSFYFENDCVDK